MKKIVCLLLAFGLVGSAYACEGMDMKQTQTQGSSEQKPADKHHHHMHHTDGVKNAPASTEVAK